MIGTVDQLLSRQWINLTNWIKISGDLSYTVEKKKSDPFHENSYKVNLFASLRRNKFDSTVLSSFERMTHGAQLNQDLDLPVYFHYEPNRDSYYRGRLSSTFFRQSELAGLPLASNQGQGNRREISFDLGSEFFRTRTIVFKPSIMLGVRDNDNSQSGSEKLTLEWSSPRNISSLPWTIGCYLASTQTATDTNSSVFREQSLYGNVDKNLNRTTRVGLRATVRHGSGPRDNYLTDSVEIGTTKTGLNNTPNRFLLYDGQIYGEHVGALFSNRLEVMIAGIKTDADDLTSTEVQHVLKMAGQKSKFSLSSSFSRGTETAVQTVNTEYLPEENDSDAGAGFGWSSKAEYSYAPDRRLYLTLRGSIKGISGDAENHTTWQGSEKLDYNFYKSNGILRRLAEISEEFGVEGTSNELSDRSRTFFLRVLAAVYPTSYFYAKVVSEMLVYAPSGSKQIELNAETGANFQKMQVALSYGRGYKAAEGLLAEVKEERWDVKVRKTF